MDNNSKNKNRNTSRNRTAKSVRNNNTAVIDAGLQKELDIVDLELAQRNSRNMNLKNTRNSKDAMEKYKNNEIMLDNNIMFSVG